MDERTWRSRWRRNQCRRKGKKLRFPCDWIWPGIHRKTDQQRQDFAVRHGTARLLLGAFDRPFGVTRLLLGAGAQGQQFAAQMRKTKDPCMEILGFIDDRKTRVPETIHGYQVLGDTESHVDYLETQLGLVDQVGEQNYLQSQMGAGTS